MSISSTLVHGAEIRFQEAAEPLRPYVGCFWTIAAEPDAIIRVVPDGSSAISIQLQEGRPSEWSLRGPMLRPDEHRFTSPATWVGVRLRPGVAFIVSGVAADSLVDRRIGLGSARSFQALVSAEPRPQTPAQYIAVLERFLIGRLKNAVVHDVVTAALREIEREHGCLQVAEVAARCGVSVRHLNRLMRLWVGYGAKRFANVIRFQATLHRMEQSPRPSAAALASENGYFDQSHLTVDVARFAGATPGDLSSRSVAEFSKTRCDDLL
ncbi:MAG TPA: helix-turn-helix domain-containing protein [Vicinamibacterales bacterium]|jgi:AraC-like DNA-binding protein|nr:helix-turn-helix domain-containing protein [Vicinamibacterales bacterium]